MPRSENLETVRAFFDRVLNAGDAAALEGMAHQNLVVPQGSPGVDGLKRLLAQTRETFSNPEYKILEALADGEKVAVRFSAKATHSGRYLGLPPSGKTLKLWGVMIFGFEAGELSEFWSILDAPGILAQLRG